MFGILDARICQLRDYVLSDARICQLRDYVLSNHSARRAIKLLNENVEAHLT